MRNIRTAIIGLGRIAHGYKEYPTHLSALKKDKRFTLVAAADVNAEQRRLFQNKVSPAVAMYVDYRAMIKNETIDLLVVAVPTDLHYKVCSGAIELGIKNILCEKPITRALSEAVRLSKLAKSKKTKIMVNYHRSYSSDYKKLIKLIQKNEWGPIASISVQYNNGIFNTATHLIHLLEKIFGPIQKVQAIKNSNRNSEDPNISFAASNKKTNILFEGVDKVDYRLLEIDMKFKKKRLALSNDQTAEFKINMNNAMLDVYENAYQVIKNNKKPEADISSSIHALEVAARAVKLS